MLGRPSTQGNAVAAAHIQHGKTGDPKPCIWTDDAQSATVRPETPLTHDSDHEWIRTDVPNVPPPDGSASHRTGETLLLYKPQSSETIVVVDAIDTLRYENVEEEWFRHLPAHYGHAQTLDLAIQALVQACTYNRGIARMTSRDCYQTLSLAFCALRASIEQWHGQSNDVILAATALLAPFEGTIKRDGVPTRLHIDGLAAVIAARPRTHAVTQLARDILDWYAAESSIMACFQGTPSPFENILRAYFTNDGLGYDNSDRAQLKALGNELFVRIPRLVILVRTLRLKPTPRYAMLLKAHRTFQALLELRSVQVERRFMENVTFPLPNGSDTIPPLVQSLHFASAKDYEALACYWQGRLSLLRLERHFHELLASYTVEREGTDAHDFPLLRSFGPQTNEICLLAKRILISADYVASLPLFRQKHLLAYAMVVVWGATMDTSVEQSVGSTDSLSELLLWRVNRALNTRPTFLAEDMDEAADVFIGGERRGRLARFYGL
jgi:hypothetical protein